MVNASEFIKQFVSPIEMLLTNYKEETISVLDLIKIFQEVLNLKSKLKEVQIAEGGDPNLIEMFLTDVISFYVKNTYKLTDEELNNKYSVQTFIKVSKEYLAVDKFFAEEIFDKSVTDKTKTILDDYVKMFIDIEKNKSDEKNLERQMLIYLLDYKEKKLTKYNKLIVTLGGASYGLDIFVNSFLWGMAQVDALFPSEAMDDTYNKLAFMLINGVFNENDISYKSGDKVKDVVFNNFSPNFTSGQSVFLIKLVVTVLENYNYVMTTGSDEVKKAFLDVFNNAEYSLSQKASRTTRVAYNSLTKIDVKEILETVYFIVPTEEIVQLWDGVTTFSEFEARGDKIESESDLYSSEQILLDKLMKSDATDLMPKIIALNNKILQRYNDFVKKYPDIAKIVLAQVNNSIVLTHLVTMFNYPFEQSLGTYLIKAFRNVASTLAQKDKDAIVNASTSLTTKFTKIDNDEATIDKNYQDSNDDSGSTVKASNDLVNEANDLYSESTKTKKTIEELSSFAVTYKDGVPTKTDEEIVKVEGDIQKQVETIPAKVNKANELREKVVNKNVS